MVEIGRKIEERIRDFFTGSDKALLITGARQVGKTHSIRKCGRAAFASFIEINFLENTRAQPLFSGARNSQDILLRISALVNRPLIPGKTLIFFDEVQECREIVTAIKFLVEEGSYRYVLSGSYLGVELQDIRSAPVGYMKIMEMYPLDFEEFALASGVSGTIISNLRKAFDERLPADSLIHDRMMDLFRLYLIVGGMPSVVKRYLATNDLQKVAEEQKAILTLCRKDIARYDPRNKLYLKEILELIPGELNGRNKRFILKNLNENFKFSRYQNSFIWLKNAGVALPVSAVAEPAAPLLLNKSPNLFKLFLSDVGLLASMYSDGIQVKILSGAMNINFGSVYENAAAQELKAHGFELYYFNSKKYGELDFVIECGGEVIPIEIKSGKDYQRHAALDSIMATENYTIPQAYVFHNGNVQVDKAVVYLPIYMLMFLEKEKAGQPLIYHVNLEGLT